VVAARNLYIRYYIQNFIAFLLRSGGFNENMIVINHRGKVLEIGKNVADMFRLREGTYRGKNIEDVVELSLYPPVLQAIQALRKQRSTGQSVSVPVTIEQKEVLLDISSFYLPILKQHYIQIINRSDQEFARRVKSWAPVAQRMAHGIKNPLTSVKLNAEELQDILRERLGEQSRELDEYLESIISQAEKLSRISDRFMRFVRLETPRLTPVNLNQRIPELIAQWKPDSSRIKIEYQLQPDLPRALVDPEQFEFVLKTVFFNAVESISDKGRILIATREVHAFSGEDREISQHFVEIEVTDTGCGIPGALLAKIGEPYFTTKSRGTGLGLSIVKKIMEEHGGSFEIQSEENVGTTVLLRFRPAQS
jgi:nitrogen fixation/metabolism regulation signal transduction histidine kinase